MSKRITNVKKGGAKKALAVVAAVLALVIVIGVVAVYNVIDSGFIQRNQVAMKSDNYEISTAMMNYYFHTLYQNYSSTYASLGLDTSKPLADQKYTEDQTWHDFFMNMTKSNVRQLLVIAEAAKADGFKLEDDKSHDHSADETLKAMETVAASYGVKLDYYLENVYGEGVNEKVFRECYALSELASHYSEKMTDSYKFESADWDKYYKENKDTFNKVDYLSYTFKVEKAKVDKNATDDEKAAAEALDKEESKRLEALSKELAATKDADSFKAYVENYLKNDLYKGKTEEDLKKEKIDINELLADLLTEGATNTATNDRNKWLFDEKTVANATYEEKAKDGLSFTVTMILPAENTDLEDDCIYRDTYKLKDVRYIPFLASSFKDSVKDAKAAAEDALAKYKDDPTEKNFTKLAESYEGDLAEGLDKGSISDEADVWLYDSARKAGDCTIVETSDGKGYYVLYFIGDNDIKWQYQANASLVNDKYNEEYEKLEDLYKVKTLSKGLDLVADIAVAG